MRYADVTQKIAVTFDDGTLTIMSFHLEGRSPTLPFGASWIDAREGRWRRPATDANVLAELTKAFPRLNRLGQPNPQPVRYARIAATDIPTDRVYRNAWQHDAQAGIAPDLEQAKVIHLDLVRHARTAKLADLDVQWMQAMGKKDQAAADAVEAQRQVLRDAPQTLELSKVATVPELKQVWPEGLDKPEKLTVGVPVLLDDDAMVKLELPAGHEDETR